MTKSLKIAGKEFLFSEFMSCVTQEDIDNFEDTFSENDLIASCGIDPSDDTFVMVSFSGDVKIIPPQKKLTAVSASPVLYGRGVKIVFSSGLEEIIDSKLALSFGSDPFDKAKFYLNDKHLCDMTLT